MLHAYPYACHDQEPAWPPREAPAPASARGAGLGWTGGVSSVNGDVDADDADGATVMLAAMTVGLSGVGGSESTEGEEGGGGGGGDRTDVVAPPVSTTSAGAF